MVDEFRAVIALANLLARILIALLGLYFIYTNSELLFIDPPYTMIVLVFVYIIFMDRSGDK